MSVQPAFSSSSATSACSAATSACSAGSSERRTSSPPRMETTSGACTAWLTSIASSMRVIVMSSQHASEPVPKTKRLVHEERRSVFVLCSAAQTSWSGVPAGLGNELGVTLGVDVGARFGDALGGVP